MRSTGNPSGWQIPSARSWPFSSGCVQSESQWTHPKWALCQRCPQELSSRSQQVAGFQLLKLPGHYYFHHLKLNLAPFLTVSLSTQLGSFITNLLKEFYGVPVKIKEMLLIVFCGACGAPCRKMWCFCSLLAIGMQISLVLWPLPLILTCSSPHRCAFCFCLNVTSNFYWAFGLHAQTGIRFRFASIIWCAACQVLSLGTICLL